MDGCRGLFRAAFQKTVLSDPQGHLYPLLLKAQRAGESQKQFCAEENSFLFYKQAAIENDASEFGAAHRRQALTREENAVIMEKTLALGTGNEGDT